MRSALRKLSSETAPSDGLTAKRGRPKLGADKLPRAEPWKALGMSERTWYRRQAEKRSVEKG